MEDIIYNNSSFHTNDINDEHDGIMEHYPTKSTSEEFNEIKNQNIKLQNESNRLKEELKEKQTIEQRYESKIKSLESQLQKQTNETNGQRTHEQTDETIASLQSQLS